MTTDTVTLRERAERLRERIYVTFTSLAVVLTLRAHVEELSAGRAALTLVIVVSGTLLAVLVADFVSHLMVHEKLPSEREFRHMLAGVVGPAGGAGPPPPLLRLAPARG